MIVEFKNTINQEEQIKDLDLIMIITLEEVY